VLEIRDLTKRYGTNLAVDSLSFTAQPGRVLGFLGPNGAGKTTTLRMLLGLTLPSSGSTAVDGHPYRQLKDPVTVVGAVLVLIFVVDPTLTALVDDIGPFTLSGLGAAMNGGDSDVDDLLPRGVAAAVWALYTVLLAALAAMVTARRDI
jgi:energy-coupling factor transporter ATP-binding protein EcfA2